jgi:hypothetical protein
MGRHFSFMRRIVQCEHCRRPVAARTPVCPHCNHRRLRLTVAARSSGKAGSSRFPVRTLLVVIVALLAIGGYVSLRDSRLDSRIKSMSSQHWLGSWVEQAKAGRRIDPMNARAPA